MRALHFLPVYAPAWQFGGPILSVSRLCEGLVQQGIDVRVITTNAGLPDFPKDQLGILQSVNGVQVIYYSVDDESGPIRSCSLVEALPDHMAWADLLHLSSIWQPLGISVQNAAHVAGLPIIQTLRGALGPYSWRRGWWKKIPYFFLQERPLLQRAAALHCTTMQEAREISWLGLEPPVEILPNPIDFSQLHYSQKLGEEWRERVGIPLGIPLLLVAGRLHHKKGLDLLPKVLKTISDRPWQMVVIGKDYDGTGHILRRRLRLLGLEGRCHWFDSLPADQLLGPYNASDWLLLPSRHENFGNVAAEALACGCGVLLTHNVGCAEMLRSCKGVRTFPRTVTAWNVAISTILDEPRPGISASRFIQDLLAVQSVAKRVSDTYQSLMAYY